MLEDFKGKTRKEWHEIWKKRLLMAKGVHQKAVIDWANIVIEEYSGDKQYDQDTGEKYAQLAQTIMAVEETIQPHLFYQNPKVFAKAKNPSWEKRESLVAAVVNHEYTDIKPSGHGIELENELVILDARILPFGGTVCSWEVEGDILEEPPDESLIDKTLSLITGEERQPIQTPVIEKEIGLVTERFNPLEVYLDYTATHITKQKWVIRKMDVPKSKLLKPRYDQAALKDLKPSASLVPEKAVENKPEMAKLLSDPDFKGFRIYEIEDLENRVIHTLCEGYEDFIEFAGEHPLPEGSIYSFLWFIEKPNGVYPLPPLKFYRQRAKEFSYIYSQVSTQIDKFLPKIGIDKNRLDTPDQQKLQLGTLGSMVGFTGAPSGAWDLIQPQVNPDLFKYLGMIKELMNLEAGINEYEVEIPNERTATEAEIISKGTKARRFKPQKRVKGFIRNQAHVMWLFLSQNATEPRFVKILGPDDAAEWWVDPETGKDAWTKEDIAGDYYFDFDIESIAPMNKMERMAINTKGLETVSNPALQQAVMREGNELLVSPLLEKTASENWGLKDKSQIIRRMNFIEPGDEHTLWMSGQYPPINEREMKDPEYLQKHYEEHLKFINSPSFSTLPPVVQDGALRHVESYLPFIQKGLKAAPSKNEKPAGAPKPAPSGVS